jgi:hypothetical protein
MRRWILVHSKMDQVFQEGEYYIKEYS